MFVNAKIISVQTIPRIGGGRDKGEWWRGKIQV
jgi:hypothetical protein